MKNLGDIAFALVIVGAINWGLTALGINAINMLLGSYPTVEKVVYLLVGVSGLYLLAAKRGMIK